MQNKYLLLVLSAILACDTALPEERPIFRTDESQDKSLPWFQLVAGQFPPQKSAHYVTGELIACDHLERTVAIRVDRNDLTPRALWDLPLKAAMLPYGSVYYHNQHAALRDIPIGTHLHGWFYQRPKGEMPYWKGDRRTDRDPGERVTLEADFTRCLRLEDDFTFHARQNQTWKVDKVDLGENKLTATLQQDGKPRGDARQFDLLSSTTVFRGHEFAALADIQPGQHVQMNLTWATLYGPGRVTQIWVDEASRKLAAERQLERHRNHIRQRGLAGWVDAVDDEKQVVTITFFDGVDPALFKELTIINPEPLGWPTSGGAKNDLAPKGTIAVARQSLMTYDPINDRKGGNILKISKVSTPPGSSGVQIQVQCGMLLEGYRPTKIVRFYPASWRVVALPREEQFFGQE